MPVQNKKFAVQDVSHGVFIGQNHVSQARDESSLSLEARTKFKPAKITLVMPKGLERGRIQQEELEETAFLVKRAMFEAGVTEGTVLYGWHGQGTTSSDPVDHVTVQPTSGAGVSHGKMHIHRDGSWTQGPGGQVKGTGKSCK